MSRIGKRKLTIPTGVTVELNDNLVTVKGSKGELSINIVDGLKVEVNDNVLSIDIEKETKNTKAMYGTTNALISNMIIGVSNGYSKNLEIVGVGYRAAMQGSAINLSLGYSHPVVIEPPAGITITVEANTKVTVSGTNKQMVGDVAALIRSKRPPEPYKGKGVKYEGEYIARKAGKAGKK